MTDSEENEPIQQKPPLNYSVKTEGLNSANLLKSESVTRRSPDGAKLHQVILFYTGEPGSEPKEYPSRIKIATYRRSLFNRGWYFDHAAQQWNGDFDDASLLKDVIEDKLKDVVSINYFLEMRLSMV